MWLSVAEIWTIFSRHNILLHLRLSNTLRENWFIPRKKEIYQNIRWAVLSMLLNTVRATKLYTTGRQNNSASNTWNNTGAQAPQDKSTSVVHLHPKKKVQSFLKAYSWQRKTGFFWGRSEASPVVFLSSTSSKGALTLGPVASYHAKANLPPPLPSPPHWPALTPAPEQIYVL